VQVPRKGESLEILTLAGRGRAFLQHSVCRWWDGGKWISEQPRESQYELALIVGTKDIVDAPETIKASVTHGIFGTHPDIEIPLEKFKKARKEGISFKIIVPYKIADYEEETTTYEFIPRKKK
jgi:hypothetical protein